MTTNDGGSWTNVSIPGISAAFNDIQVDPFDNLTAYAIRDQYGPGKIFMTTNGGTKWTDISSNLPDEPALTLAIDPRTTPETLYLGNNIGVYVSYDLGGSWVRFGSGLPNVQVKQLDLQLNNGVDVMGAGTFGRGLFEIQENTPLVVTAVTPIGLVEGRESDDIETATFTDVNAPANTDPAAYYSATIFWGDGSSSAGTIVRDAGNVFHVTGSHTYAEEGMEMITTEITSGGGSSGGATATTTVLDAPLYGSAGNEITGIAGKSTGTVLLGAFTDANPFAAVADYTTPPGAVVVNWGDGTADSTLAGGTVTLIPIGMPAGVVWTITAAHTYVDEGTYAYTVTVTDRGGAETIVDGSAIIAHAPPLPGPVIDGLYFNRLNGQVDFIIKDPVPAAGVAPPGVSVNTLRDSSNYLLTTVHANKAYPGKWVVTKVTDVKDPKIPYAYDVAVTFNGGAIIPGGFYLFTIRDSSNGNSSVQDLDGNHLDGVFYGTFPSGNGKSGSDFVAELEAYHNKVFAPQTIIGTSSAANGGNGGLPVAPVHSGMWVPAVPMGGPPIFSTPTSPSNGGDPPAATGHTTKKPKGQIVVKAKHSPDTLLSKSTERAKPKVVVSNNHPEGPKHT